MFKLICFCLISSVLIGSSIGLPQQQFQPQPTSGQLQAGPQVSGPGPQEAAGGPPQPPQISWGKCPQLEPKESEKKVKAEIISNCLKSITLPENITQESVEKHRTEVARCALNAENWFTADGKYRYEKAETEIKNKKLTPDVEPQVLRQHNECKKEAEEQFAAGIAQIQLYQACMDYHISMICGIQIVGASPPQ
ncbi:uncharacterized protein LOC128385454 [Panonychus citri]|uniref:uncharacterized protein LOC128385454 n=1 Tax=Panonychus citri TaxID=50023 RepID=UPI0023071E00|nr:uncharacterized protein LOC128385454 [Panonychus citri]